MKRWQVILLTTAGVLAVTVGSLFAFLQRQSDIYRIFDSPKGKYHLIVYHNLSLRSLLGAMPGGGGVKDSPGFVRLYDSNGTLYGEKKIPWVQGFDSTSDIMWSDDEVIGIGDDGFHMRFPKE